MKTNTRLGISLINYAINEACTDDVAKILGVEPDSIEQALIDFKEEWDECDEPAEADEVVDKWELFFTSEMPVTDITLTKNHNSDMLEWWWQGKYFWCQGEFFIDKDNILHHTFIAPNGKEFEITIDY